MKSKYPAAADAIRNWISREALKPGAILPPSPILAEKCGFTPATILRASQILISKGLLRRTGYRLSVGPQVENAPVIDGTIYVVSYYDRFTRSAVESLAHRGVVCRTIDLSHLKHPRLEPVLGKILQESPAGLILWAPTVEDEADAVLKESRIPMVVCANGMPASGKSSIQMDLFRAAEIALKHLYDLGHRHIAHVSMGHGRLARELAAFYRAVSFKLGLNQSSSMIWPVEIDAYEVLLDTLLKGRQSHPEVTALFGDDRVGICATENFLVPSEISTVGLFDLLKGRTTRPPLTTVALPDRNNLALLACTELISQIQTIASGWPPLPPTEMLLVPQLHLRGTTRALVSSSTVPEVPARAIPAKISSQGTWQNIYPFLEGNNSDHWRQLDLSKLANHSMTRQHGWLGSEPLEHFPPGLRSIHGVPFQVLDENGNDGKAVITFRSPHSHSANREKLPIEAKVKINSCVKALYFLHGCGFAKPVPFATYSMHFKSGKSDSLRLIPLGASLRLAAEQLKGMEPNIQDWWPTFDQMNFPHAHHALVCHPADPKQYERSLYSLEWINPLPQDEIEFIQVQVDPEAGPALALIAITALL